MALIACAYTYFISRKKHSLLHTEFVLCWFSIVLSVNAWIFKCSHWRWTLVKGWKTKPSHWKFASNREESSINASCGVNALKSKPSHWRWMLVKGWKMKPSHRTIVGNQVESGTNAPCGVKGWKTKPSHSISLKIRKKISECERVNAFFADKKRIEGRESLG